MRQIHPGEILRKEFLEPLNISPSELASALHISASTVDEVLRGKHDLTADMAIRLGRYFNTSARFWMNLQADYSLAIIFAAHGQEIERQVQPHKQSVKLIEDK